MARQTHIVQSEDPVRVTVEPLHSSDLSWFRLFRSVVHSGAWARLTPAAAKVLVVLAECVNDAIRKEQNRWIAWPSIATIGIRAGIERRAAQKAIACLEEHGLVRRCRRSNSSRGDYSNEYELTPPPASSDAQGGAHASAQEGANTQTHVRASVDAPRPRKSKRPPGAAARAQQRTDQTETRSDSSIRTQLVRAGIGEPVLSRLLNTEKENELLLRLKDWETRKRMGSKYGVAWLIASITNKYDLHERTRKEIEQATHQAAARTHRIRQLEAEAEEERRQRQIEAQALELFEQMSDEELLHWKRIVLEEMPGLVRGADRADPRSHAQLRRLILGKLGHLVCPNE